MKKHVKLRAMTNHKFCETQQCETCPEFLRIPSNLFGSQCALNIITMFAKTYKGDQPYRNSDGKYLLVQADD